MEKNKNLPGVLSVIQLEDSEKEILLDYLMGVKPATQPDYIFTVLGKEFLKFYDVFAGTTFKVPSREELLRIINYVKIYSYCKERSFSNDSYDRAAKIFKKRPLMIREIVDKVANILDRFEE